MWAKIITIKRAKDLNYFSLCALNLFNTQVSQFELNYHDILIYWDALVYFGFPQMCWGSVLEFQELCYNKDVTYNHHMFIFRKTSHLVNGKAVNTLYLYPWSWV